MDDEFRDDTYDFLEERDFQLTRRRVFHAGDGFVAEWLRGELRLAIRRPENDPDIHISFQDGADGVVTNLYPLLSHLGIRPRPLSAPIEVLRNAIDRIIVHYTYAFLVDRGFRLASNDNRGGGSYTLVFRRAGLDLRIDVNGDDEHIDLNGVSLAEVLRANGIEGRSFADLRKHIDVILAKTV